MFVVSESEADNAVFLSICNSNASASICFESERHLLVSCMLYVDFPFGSNISVCMSPPSAFGKLPCSMSSIWMSIPAALHIPHFASSANQQNGASNTRRKPELRLQPTPADRKPDHHLSDSLQQRSRRSNNAAFCLRTYSHPAPFICTLPRGTGASQSANHPQKSTTETKQTRKTKKSDASPRDTRQSVPARTSGTFSAV